MGDWRICSNNYEPAKTALCISTKRHRFCEKSATSLPVIVEITRLVDTREQMKKRITYFSGSLVLKHPQLSLTAKFNLLLAKLRDKLGANCSVVKIPIGNGLVEVNLYRKADWFTFKEVILEDEYKADFKNKAIIDVGAHRGYFLAKAAKEGAKHLSCFEPEADNFAALKRVADSLNGSSCSVDVYKSAIAKESGQLELHVSNQSWSHSLASRDDRECLHKETISAITLADAIADVKTKASNSPILLKLDAEGSEGEILLNTPAAELNNIEHIIFEYHHFCSTPYVAIKNYLEKCGFVDKSEYTESKKDSRSKKNTMHSFANATAI